MIVVFKGIENSQVLVFDAEYSEGYTIQFAGMLFRKIEKNTFQIEKSLNVYIRLPEGIEVNRFIRDFTGITDSYLDTFGVDLKNAKEMIGEFATVPEHDLLVISHGLTNDRRTLMNAEINLYHDLDGKEIQGLCTYNAAKRLLKREKRLRLEDVAADAGVFLGNTHNAFDDMWATVSVFSLLRKLEEEQKREKLLQSRED